LFNWPNVADPGRASSPSHRSGRPVVSATSVEGREVHSSIGRRSTASIHTSNVEPPILFAGPAPLTPHLHILYKAELRKLPILNIGFDLVGFIPVDRGNREQTTRAVNAAVARPERRRLVLRLS
jgi:hypothetical protein